MTNISEEDATLKGVHHNGWMIIFLAVLALMMSSRFMKSKDNLHTP